ncbi:MAG: PAS domain-containing protein, partial [Bacteroidales bacterium]|nr:PAS domain-containing protein [Bacteroidales bacterium]
MIKFNTKYHEIEMQPQGLETFFFENSPDLFCILDNQWMIVRINKSWEEVLGWSSESLPGVELMQIVHPEDTDYMKFMLGNAFKGTVQNAESRLISKSGEVFWFSWKSVLQEDKKLIHVVARDISLRKKTIQKLEEQSRRFFLATKATDTGIWDWLIHQNKVYYSNSWKSQLGYEKDELTDSFETWQMLLHHDDYERANNELSAYLENPTELFESEFRLRHKDGSYRLIYCRAASLIGKDMKPYRMLGTHRDITEQRKFENELKDARIKAETANIHKNNFLANMGHEIRTPMNGIIGFSELLKEPDLDFSDKERYIGIINENCNQLLDLVDDIVDISKIEANEINLQFSCFSIRELLQETREFFNTHKYRVNKSHIEIRVITPDFEH